MRDVTSRSSRSFIAAFTIALLTLASASHAQVIFGWGGGSVRTDGGIVAGNSFNSGSPQTINALGFYDHNADGLAGSYQVGLWDSSQTLIGSGTVTPSDPLINGFRWTSITPVVINGTFTFGALLPSSPPDPWLDAAFPVLGVGYTGAGTGRFVTSGVLTFPTSLDPDNEGYIVANAGNLNIPEPATLSLLAPLVLLHRRRPRRLWK